MEITTGQHLAEVLLAESNPETLKVLISQHMALMDAAFFQLLREVAADPKYHDQLHQIVSSHLKLSGEDWYDHYEISVQMGRAWESGTLDTYLDAHSELITPELIATLIQSAEDGIAKVGFLQTGLMLLKVAEAAAQRFDIQTHRTHLYLTLSSYHLYLNQNDEAQHAITRARECLTEQDERTRQALLVNEGLLKYRAGNYREAIEHYESSLKTITDPVLRFDAQSNQAIALSEMGRFSEAINLLQAAIKACDPDNEALQLSRTYGNLANLFGRLGLLDDEARYLHRSIEVSEQQSDYHFDWHTLITNYVNLTLHYFKRDNLPEAEKWFDRFVETARKTDAGPYFLTYARIKAHLEFKKGNTEKALKVIENAQHQFENREDVEYLALLGIASVIRYRNGDFLNALKLTQKLEDAARKTHCPELLISAYAYHGLCRYNLGELQAAHRYFSQSLAGVKQIRKNIEQSDHQYHFSADKAQLNGEIIEASLEGDTRRLFNYLQRIKSQATAYQLNCSADYSEIQAALPENTLLAEYYINGSQAFCLLVSRRLGEPVVVHLPTSEESLKALVLRYAQTLTIAKHILNRNPFEFLSIATEALIQPIFHHLKDYEQVVIAASSYAHDLPFSIFPDPRGGLLIDHLAITHAPNGALFQACQTSSQQIADSVVIANSKEGDSEKSRGIFAEEARRVSSFLGVSPCIECDDSLETLIRKPEAEVIHIASHGHFDASNPMQSGLTLKQSGIDFHYHLDQLAALNFSADLIFFSGCDTGKVNVLPGEEILGPLSILLGGGARSLILSRWPILAESDTTLSVIEKFYRNWKPAGMNKAAALRRAILDSKTEPNPYAWAGYYLTGAM